MTRRKRNGQVGKVRHEYVEGRSSLRLKCKNSGFEREIGQRTDLKKTFNACFRDLSHR